MGGDNYRRLVPRGSYIDVNNFKSIKALTNYLVHLDNNPVSIYKYRKLFYRSAQKSDFTEFLLHNFFENLEYKRAPKSEN